MKIKKQYIIIILILILSPAVVTLSRYVVKGIHNYIMEANNFYFSSDKLSTDNPIYQVNNWTGVDPFYIQFELNNKKNNILYSTSDIEYNLTIECDDDIECSLNNTEGTIYSDERTDNFTITVNPKRSFNDKETVNVKVHAQSTSPYRKLISAEFNITVGKRGIAYEIDDEENQPYLNFIITNSLTSYYVREDFGDYQIGDEISASTYKSLSEENQNKCSSAIVTLTFNPEDVVIDTTSEIMKKSSVTYQEYNNISYINSLTFTVDATSSNEIRFYKVNVNNNYTYPQYIENEESIIEFSAITDPK